MKAEGKTVNKVYENKQGRYVKIEYRKKHPDTKEEIYESERYYLPESAKTVRDINKAINLRKLAFEEEMNKKYQFNPDARQGGYTIENFIPIYLDHIKRNKSKSYYQRSIVLTRLIIEKLGKVKLKFLTPALIQNFFNFVDDRIKTTITYTPKPNIKEILKSKNVTYTVLDKEIKKSTISGLYHGRNVSIESVIKICKMSNLNENDLFIKKEESKPYAYNTNKKYRIFLQGMLTFAKKRGEVTENYALASYIDTPPDNSKEINTLNPEQIKILINAIVECEDIRKKTAFIVLINCMLRRGELCALEYDDLDFEKRIIKIRRSRVTAGKEIIEKTTKTKSSIRDIPMTELLYCQLQEYKIWHQKQKELYGSNYKDSNKLFTATNGVPLHPQTINSWLDKLLEEAGLPHFTVHSLRHTSISLALSQHLSFKAIQSISGHSSSGIMLDTYGYTFMPDKQNVVDAVSSVFSSNDKLSSDARRLGFENVEDFQEFLDMSKKYPKLNTAEKFYEYKKYISQFK